MGILDKARDALGKNRGKIDEGIQKAAKLAKEKTGGQHADKIDRIAEKGKEALDRMDEPGRPDEADRPNPPSEPGPPSQATPPDPRP
jgi:hypothetical protein